MTTGAGFYITGKFIYSALGTASRHSEISDKEELDESDRRFLEDSVDSVDEYLGWGKKAL